ncbi:MAG: biotin-dependent carboxyltransferase family protein [Candidatus Riflebacteria bacterium]|nr:biotin-dependent carboxyltransferase family protein [Candidatus Riflebacteria bacterium]
MIVVVAPGLLTTVQDGGRPGFRAFGVPVAGAMDRLSWALANALVGNRPGAAALEMTLLGGTFRFERSARVALCGADMRALLDGRPVAVDSTFQVPAGGQLVLGAATAGARTYLAVRGGIDVPEVLGSRSTYVRAGLGGFRGRTLAPGDRLLVGSAAGEPPPPGALPFRLVAPPRGPIRIRAIPGPQEELFTAAGIRSFFATPFEVTNRNDRMGYHLRGAPIEHAGGADIVSDPVVPGAVQVPASGAPIVMMMDAQTAGGYAKIATVIGADLRLMAQARMGDTVAFEECADGDAVEALREERRLLEGWTASPGTGRIAGKTREGAS